MTDISAELVEKVVGHRLVPSDGSSVRTAGRWRCSCGELLARIPDGPSALFAHQLEAIGLPALLERVEVAEGHDRAVRLDTLRPIAAIHSRIGATNEPDDDPDDGGGHCAECETAWPCATRIALRQAIRDGRGDLIEQRERIASAIWDETAALTAEHDGPYRDGLNDMGAIANRIALSGDAIAMGWAERDALAAKVADAGERIALAIEAEADREEARLERDAQGLIGNWVGGIRVGAEIARAALTEAEYTSSVERLRAEYLEMRASGFGFTDLYAAEWDRIIAAHDEAIRAEVREAIAIAIEDAAHRYRKAAFSEGTPGEKVYRDAAAIARSTDTTEALTEGTEGGGDHGE